MVEIIAIVRPNKTQATKKALIEVGCPGYTCQKVMGRGKKPLKTHLDDGSFIKTQLISKRFFIIIAEDEKADIIVKKIMEVNNTGAPGDGKIFISPVTSTYSVRTGKL